MVNGTLLSLQRDRYNWSVGDRTEKKISGADYGTALWLLLLRSCLLSATELGILFQRLLHAEADQQTSDRLEELTKLEISSNIASLDSLVKQLAELRKVPDSSHLANTEEVRQLANSNCGSLLENLLLQVSNSQTEDDFSHSDSAINNASAEPVFRLTQPNPLTVFLENQRWNNLLKLEEDQDNLVRHSVHAVRTE